MLSTAIGGSLTVDGGTFTNYGTLATEDLTVDGTVYLGENSYTTVNGDCTVGRSDQTKVVTNYYYSGSTLEVKGDFTQTNKNDSNYSNYYAYTTFLFTGSDLQTISFADTTNKYGKFVIRNPQVSFATDVYGWTLQEDTVLDVPLETNFINGLNLNGYTLTINADVDVSDSYIYNYNASGSLNIKGNSNFYKLKTYNLTTAGDVTIKGNDGYIINTGTSTIGGSLTVDGGAFYNYGTLATEDLTVDGTVYLGENSYTTVNGDCTVGRSDQTKVVTNDYYSGSTLEVKGDFTQTNKNDSKYSNYYTGATFLFTGSDLQTISFADTTNYYGRFIVRNSNVKFLTDIYSWTLQEDTTLNNPISMSILSKINLNGFDLIINGVLIPNTISSTDDIASALNKVSNLKDVIIYGDAESVAESYAKANGLKFSTLSDEENQTIMDILRIKKYILGLSSATDESLDLNNDGNINILDLATLKQKLFSE